MKKRVFFKELAMVAAGVMALSSVPAAGFISEAQEEYPEKIVLPLELIDYDADNLLFQYDLGDAVGNEFAFTSAEFVNAVGAVQVPINGSVENTFYAQGLVGNELNEETRVPQYKREVVEKVAGLVQAQLAKPAAGATTQIFQELQSRLVTKEADAVEFSNLTDASLTKKVKYFYDYGWQIQGEGYTQADGEIRDSAGNVIWKQETDGILYYGNGNADDTLVLRVTGLEPTAQYKIHSWKGLGTDQSEFSIDLQVYDSNGMLDSDKAARDMEADGVTEITLKIVPTPNMEGNGEKIAALHVSEVVGSTENKVCDDILKQVEENSFAYTGWKAANEGLFSVSGAALVQDGIEKWKFEGDGLEARGTTETVYRELALRAGKQYFVSYLGASAMQIDIYDAEGAGELVKENVQTGDMFTCPESGKIKIVVKGSGEEYKTYEDDPTWWQRNKLAQLSLSEISCPLGTYEDSEQKYADGTKGYNDISTCMDYAYYMLNNFFVPTADTNKHPYDGYKTLTLSYAGNGEYEFVADISEWTDAEKRYEVIYDRENGDIRNNRNALGGGDGLFPLDGIDTDENTYVAEPSGNVHNFHYAMSSHSYFYYDQSKDLFFEFAGDDDVYLFINGKLALDIGGAHLAARQKITLNELQEQLGLEDGHAYQFDFFYLERHTDYSNFYVRTNIRLLDAGEPGLNFYQNGSILEDGSIVEKGSEIELEYLLKSNVDGLTNIQFYDRTLGIGIGVNGFQNTNGNRIYPNGIRIRVYRADGSEEETFFDPAAGEEISNYFRSLTLNFGDQVAVSGFLYSVTDRLDADVSVTFDSPRYAGAVSDIVSNEDNTAGIIDVKEDSQEPGGNDEGTGKDDGTGNDEGTGKDEGTGNDDNSGGTAAPSSPGTDSSQAGTTTTPATPAKAQNQVQPSDGNSQKQAPVATESTPATADTLPWAVSIVVILLIAAGICFRIPGLWADKTEQESDGI